MEYHFSWKEEVFINIQMQLLLVILILIQNQEHFIH